MPHRQNIVGHVIHGVGYIMCGPAVQHIAGKGVDTCHVTRYWRNILAPRRARPHEASPHVLYHALCVGWDVSNTQYKNTSLIRTKNSLTFFFTKWKTGKLMSQKKMSVCSTTCLCCTPRWYKPWFYKHVETYLRPNLAPEGAVEFIPTVDFFHRHNKVRGRGAAPTARPLPEKKHKKSKTFQLI